MGQVGVHSYSGAQEYADSSAVILSYYRVCRACVILCLDGDIQFHMHV